MLCRLIRPANGADADNVSDSGAGARRGQPWETGPASMPTPIAWRSTDGGPPGAGAAPHVRALPAASAAGSGASEIEIQARVQAAYRQGETAGTQAATARLTAPLASLGQVARGLSELGPKVRAEAELAVVQLAVAIARRVLHRELSTDPQALAGLVKSACERLNARELNRLRVAAADAAMLQEHRARIGLPQGLEIAADPGLAPGSVIFETVRGEMDASVETQLDEIERGLADRMRRRT